MLKTVEPTRVFQKILQAEQDGYSVIKLQGGSRSSKTWSIFQFFMMKAIQGEEFTVTITREHLQLIKDTLLVDLEEMANLYSMPFTPDFNPNRPSQTYILGKGKFVFWGLDKPKKAHGRKQTYTWMNEVIEIPNKDVFDQLEMRTDSIMIIDYNPSDEDHWIFDLDKRPDVYTFVSTVLDNPHAPLKIRNKILSYEPTEENIKNGTADQYMWDVYGLGKPAKLEGLIFENWDIVDSIPEAAESKGYGMDFGYSNDPTTLTEVFMMDNEIYLDELLYKKGLLNTSPNPSEETIVTSLRNLGVGVKEIVADSSEPKSIQEIAAHGFNIHGAQKGPDSVNFGINLMKGYKMHITKRSINVIKEFRKYKWALGRDGKSLNTPVDEFNHAIDGIRYKLMDILGARSGVQVYPSGILG